MKCHRCNAENLPSDARYCPVCGRRPVADSVSPTPQLRIVVKQGAAKLPTVLAPGKYLIVEQVSKFFSSLFGTSNASSQRSEGVYPLAKGSNVILLSLAPEFTKGLRIVNGEDVSVVDFDNFKAEGPFNALEMFKGCSSLTTVDLTGMGCVKVCDAAWMFYGCRQLRSINMGNLDFCNVTSFNRMFSECSAIEEINLESVHSRRPVLTDYMFEGCHCLSHIDFTGWCDVRITSALRMFASCWKIKDLSLAGLNFGSVTNINGMFDGCLGLERVDFSGLNLDKMTVPAARIFDGCRKLREVILRHCSPKTQDMITLQINQLVSANPGMKVNIIRN